MKLIYQSLFTGILSLIFISSINGQYAKGYQMPPLNSTPTFQLKYKKTNKYKPLLWTADVLFSGFVQNRFPCNSDLFLGHGNNTHFSLKKNNFYLEDVNNFYRIIPADKLKD